MARPSNENGEILKAVAKLARKLGKYPSAREIERFVCSERQIKNHFSSFKELKELVFKTHSELNDIIVPAKVTYDDLNDYKLELERKKVEKSNKIAVDNLLTIDTLSRFVDTIFVGQIKPYKPAKAKKEVTRALNLTLSDLHFGADIKAEETGYLTYGPVEEARRFAEVIKQTIDYKPHYRNVTELHVNLLGDLFEGKLHDAQNAAYMSEQVCRTIHLLGQGLAQLAESFGSIKVYCATGNHGRDLNRHRERATSGKWDSLETVVYFALQKILKSYKNMKFIIPKTPYVEYKALGHNVFVTHGDTVLKIGNPGKSINVSNFENQIIKMNNNRKSEDKIKIGICGHMHCASVSNLNTGIVMITNGTLQPVGQFDVSLGFRENRASQTLFEMTPAHALGDIRFLRVGETEDKNASLDKIIKPYENLND